ncbi:hypothetical protein EUGRSUZ_L00614 [Eucalyptus grandis]|uniref:GH18 domain-containing protein n=1 Tax=Eucalyptus grandis TaxID=71139 RepID=A0A058ZVX5_EUCGR|nr:hypothetical protein EUGRSUZ_L00614 [Eucalyptus grandis]
MLRFHERERGHVFMVAMVAATEVELDLSSYEVVITDVDKKWTKNFIATLHANNPPAKAHLSVGGIASNLSIFAALTVNFKNYWGAIPRSVIGVARVYNFDGIDSDWEFPTSPQNMSNLSHLLEELQISLEKEHIASGRQKLLLMATVYFSAEFFLSNDPTMSYPGRPWPSTRCSTTRQATQAQAMGYRRGISTVGYDPETMSTYFYAGTSRIGHDGPTSIENKVKFAKEQGLGGYLLWAVGYDDQDWTLSRTDN